MSVEVKRHPCDKSESECVCSHRDRHIAQLLRAHDHLLTGLGSMMTALFNSSPLAAKIDR